MLAHRIRYHCNYAMGKYKVHGVCVCVCVCFVAGECCSAQGRLFTRDFTKVSSLSLVQYLVQTQCLVFAHFTLFPINTQYTCITSTSSVILLSGNG